MHRRFALLVALVPSIGFAQPATLDAQRCAVKVAVTLTGRSPDAALLANVTPQSQIDTLLGGTLFIERLARFINARFNDEPGANSAEDATYHLAKHVLTNRLPWRQMFLGPFRVDTVNNAVTVVNDTNGLGYLRSPAWLRRYAGNEEQGVKLATAYRMLNNITGLNLTAAVQVPGLDVSAQGRRAAACSGCHYDHWFALDKLSSVLTKRVGAGDAMRFEAPTAGPQQLLDGRTISNDRELVTALVGSTEFDFNACRLAFEFVYGRKEQDCEGPQFDRCVDAFRAQGTLQSAIASLTKDASFCGAEGANP
jgi:hypothetical protein